MTVDDALQRVADYEQRLRPTALTRTLRHVGRLRVFSRFYRWYGPKVDPALLRWSRGRYGARVVGLPALLLTTTGARTGARRVSPLLYVRDGRDFAVVGTNFGQLTHPAWTANLRAHPEAQVEVGPARLTVTATPADPATWERLWPRFVDIYPGYADYLTRCGDRAPRMFLLHPTGTLGPVG